MFDLLVDEIAKELVRCNLENFNIMVEEGEITPTATNFKDYGICEENVEAMIKHRMNEILAQTTSLQSFVAEVTFK